MLLAVFKSTAFFLLVGSVIVSVVFFQSLQGALGFWLVLLVGWPAGVMAGSTFGLMLAISERRSRQIGRLNMRWQWAALGGGLGTIAGLVPAAWALTLIGGPASCRLVNFILQILIVPSAINGALYASLFCFHGKRTNTMRQK